jgi:hypothetical protein
VWDGSAAQEAEEPLVQRLASLVAEPWHLARGLGDVLEQSRMLFAGWFSATHLASLEE